MTSRRESEIVFRVYMHDAVRCWFCQNVSRCISVLTYRLSISNAVRGVLMDDGVSDVFNVESNVNSFQKMRRTIHGARG